MNPQKQHISIGIKEYVFCFNVTEFLSSQSSPKVLFSALKD